MKTGGRIGLVGLLALWVWGVALAQTLPREVRERIIAATVLITDGNGHGSGTLISPQGYILTNYHVIGDLENRRLAHASWWAPFALWINLPRYAIRPR
ncbi:hypothetical protein [Meiothermus rufus]|uniref:hypothetical protein n=1 Tax=Meiothermus rufus TaxID=604332 RepID=UPI0003F94FF0|nr:hypothetical protein [Meiothermus rufus]